MEAASSVTKEQKDTDFFELFKHIFFPEYNSNCTPESKDKIKTNNEDQTQPYCWQLLSLFSSVGICVYLPASYPIFIHHDICSDPDYQPVTEANFMASARLCVCTM